jgi:hypothetical protein
VFLNKLGLWEMFTSHGKVTVKNKIKKAVTGRRSFRDPSKIATAIHILNLENFQRWCNRIRLIQALTEDMNSTIEQIIYSPKVYLIKFKSDKQITTVGLTIDSNGN